MEKVSKLGIGMSSVQPNVNIVHLHLGCEISGELEDRWWKGFVETPALLLEMVIEILFEKDEDDRVSTGRGGNLKYCHRRWTWKA